MEDLLIENIDDDLVQEIQGLARSHGRTFDEEVIRLLELGLAIEMQKHRQTQSLSRSAGPKI